MFEKQKQKKKKKKEAHWVQVAECPFLCRTEHKVDIANFVMAIGWQERRYGQNYTNKNWEKCRQPNSMIYAQ